MKIIHLSNSDKSGGAAIAAYRIHKSLIKKEINSRMWVNSAISGDWTVRGPKHKLSKGLAQVKRHLVKPLLKLTKTENKILHSPAILPSSWSKKLNKSNADIVQLHWIGAEMASISDIGAINKPVIWTLHDMWAFCGAEHISWDQRWRNGYNKKNRPTSEKGFDVNRWTWNRKVKNWKQPFNVVAVSNWLAECSQNSKLMKDWPTTVIPNCLDTETWKPINKTLARELLGLPNNIQIIGFGSYGANTEFHKGFDLLLGALDNLREEIKDLELAIFGQAAPKEIPDYGFNTHFMGHLHDDISLRLFYSAIDLLVVPSRLEAFGQTASESLACATPVVAFGTSGLLDIIDHKVNGYLAKPFETEDLSNGMKFILNSTQYEELCDNARQKSITKFDSRIVSTKYKELYTKILRCQN